MKVPGRMLLLLLLASAIPAQGKNLLFYGNSFTYYVWGYGVPEAVGWIATAAGHANPTIVSALTGGGTLQYYATDPAQIAAIGSLPPGQTWDCVVMQGHALEATNGLGFNAATFRSSAVTIMGNVRAHSPAARAVMFQTWASAWGQMYYPMPWPVPMAMHDEIRGNYHLAVADIDAAFGAGAASNAAVGDAVALLEWDPAWYEADRFHPSPSMILLAAMCIYTSVYGQTVCEIDFQPASPLGQALAAFGIGEAEWQHLAGLADRCADPALRHYPGSGDHLLLETGAGPGPATACPLASMTVGTFVQMRLRSLNGVYDGAPGWLLINLFLTGAPPGPSPTYPEVQVDFGSMLILTSSATLANPLSFAIPMPFSFPGLSVLVQGLAAQESTETGNPVFTTTDAHELVFY
ncbi:MAG TPA: SGNH/GDSL hydrolase family protein [Planctomycetota bacterium]|nr:SGNH/GDSL hydrolase family protein [Planctomycetota bacterium]